MGWLPFCGSELAMAKPTIEAITKDNLQEFADFLVQNMSYRRSSEAWIEGLSANWAAERPNFGYMLRDEGRVVGGIGAIYADRLIRGQTERFCNITSWCVLDDYRKFSMQLAMRLVAQEGIHLTDFSPTKVVAGALQFLKFQPLDEAVIVLPNLPVPGFGWRVEMDPVSIGQEFSGDLARKWLDHSAFPWLNQLLLGRPGQWCHVIYKRRSFKGLPCASILHLSAGGIFLQGLAALKLHFLLHGMVSTHVERRMLPAVPRIAKIRTGFNTKQFKSDTLSGNDIDYLYSESVALDL
jgi:hypothetical protein